MFDILILAKKEDFNKIKFLLDSVKSNITGYDGIYVISNEPFIMDGVINYTDEMVLDVSYKDKIRYRPNWIFQQFLKLFQNITKNDKYLVIDSDIFLNKKISIFTDGKPNFFIGRNQYHQPYFEFLNKFNIQKNLPFSFISELMLFDKSIISDFLSKNNLSIQSFIEKSCSIIDGSCHISEFELYGNMIMQYYNGSYNFTNLTSVLLGKGDEWSDDEILEAINKNKNYDIITYHTWK